MSQAADSVPRAHAPAVSVPKGCVWSTRDLALAAFCLEHGLEIVRATRRGKEYEFLFRDPEHQANELSIRFANSPEARFDAAMRAIKKLCHRNGSGR